MRGKQSVFHNERKRWEPVNRQAAGVFKRAHWDEMPPTEPRFIPSDAERAQACIKAAQERIAANEAKAKAHREDVAQQKARNKEWQRNREKIARCQQHAKITLRTIHKRKGLPKPTPEQVRAFRETLPMYGQKI